MEAETAPVLSLTGVSKSFPGVRALHDVTFGLKAGEVTALIGENGAGKSTIVKILTGIYTPDAGEIVVRGKVCAFASPRESWAAGVAAIHQETVMFDELSVAENIFTGHIPGGRFIDWSDMRRRSSRILERIEADFDAATPLKQLSVAQKHMVEIARALSHEASVIIMDEPTAALSRNEIDDLFRIVAQLKSQGCAILFISHKFDEIFRVADAYICLRDGEMAGSGRIAEATEAKLVRQMVGRPIDQVFPKRDIAIGETVLEVEGLSNPTEFADISFKLRLLWSRRRRALRGGAMSVRHEPADARRRPPERRGGRDRLSRRRDTRGHLLCAGGSPAARRFPADEYSREYDAGLDRRACERIVPVAILRARGGPQTRTPA
jgi:rhamnose transport system ATP-binding protein